MIAPDGLGLAVYDRGPDRESGRAFLAHATGFCAAVWAPVVDRLEGPTTVWDFRGHGRSGAPARPLSWWEMGADAAAVRDHTKAANPVGVGHSMGGAALLMAQLGNAARFSALVLVEPIVFPPPYRRSADQGLVGVALRRRTRFSSREQARANFAGKPPFARWHPAALAGYLDGGLVEDGGGVGLACHPELEAEVYTAAPAHGLLDRLGEVTIPVSLMVGAGTDTYPPAWGERLAAAFPAGRLELVEGTGHFLPMERPDVVARAVVAAMAAVQ